MKPQRSNPLFARFFRGNTLASAVVVTLAGLAIQPVAFAANQTYQDASGLNTWNTTDANWDAGVVWTNTNTATFAGTGEAVTVSAVTANGITFNSAGYNLTGGTITLGASSTITAAANAGIGSAIAGGTFSLTKAGAGKLTLSGAQSYTGDFSHTAGDSTFASGFSLNNSMIAMTGTTGTITVEAGATVTTKYINLGNSGGSSGRVAQSGGTVTLASGGSGVRIGHWGNGANAASVYNLSGGTLDATALSANAGAARLVNVGWDGTGTMTVGGGAGAATLKAFGIQLDANGNGGGNDGGNDTLTVSSNGALEVGAGNINGASSGDRLILDGGTVKATAALAINSVTNANSSTTSTINTNGFAVTIGGDWTDSGTVNVVDSTATSGNLILTTTGTTTIAAGLTTSLPTAKTGAGTITLGSAASLSGTLAINVGRLNISGGIAPTTTSVASGATLGGEGTVGGTVTPAAGSNIGVDPTTAGAITFTNLNLTGQPNVTFNSVPSQAQSPVKLFTYTGTLTSPGGLATDLKGLGGYANPVVTDTAGVVTFSFSTQNLTWGGPGSVWDVKTTANWANGGSQNFAWGDAVTFDDTAGVPTNITLTGEIQPASIVVNSSTNNFTIAGSTGNFIAGTGSLLKSGTSTLTMDGPNTFTGGVVISQGTIQVKSATALGAGTVTLGDASTGSNNTALYIDTNRVNFVRPLVISANGTGTATLGTRSTVGGTGASNGFNGITLAKDVIFDSNAADRTDYVNISGTGNITVTGGGRTVFTTTNTFAGNLTVSPSAVGGHLQNGVATAANTNYIPDATNVTVTDFASATQAEFRLSTTSETINGLNGNGTIDTNSINTTLTVGGAGGGGAFSGTIQNGGANTVTLTKTGAGTQVLSGTNTYTGVTTISGGILQFGKQASLYNGIQASWTPANIKVSSGATAAFSVGGTDEFTTGTVSVLLTNLKTIVSNGLQAGSFIGFNTANASGGTFTIADVIANSTGTGSGAVGVRKTGTGTLVLSGANTYTGTTNVDAGTMEVTNNAGGTAKFYSVAQGATLQLGYSTSVGFGYGCGVTVNGTSAGDASGLYIKGGQGARFGGTLTLQTAPSTVRAYGTGSATLYGGDVNQTYLSVPATGSGSVIDSAVNIVADSYGYRMSTVAGANTATGDLVINSVISGSGSNNNGGPYGTSLRKEGTGSVLLTAANTYGNGVCVNGGSIIVGGGDDRLPVGAGVILNSGTFLRLNGISQTVSNVSNAGSGGAVVGNSATLSSLTINAATNATLSTLIGGTGTNENNIALGKSGSGILTLVNSNNTYEGGTTVNAGTLRIIDSSGTVAGTGAVTVNPDGTLDGYGTLNNDVTVSAAGGTVAGGTGVDSVLGDTLTVGSLTFEGTGAISVIPNFTSIAVSNALTASGSAGSVAVNIGTTPLSVGTYTLVTHSGPIGGTGVSAFTVGTNPGGPFNYAITDNGSELRLTVTTSALFWNGNNGNEWSIANNWKNGVGAPVSFSNGAAVVFNDAATSSTVDLSSANVTPSSVTFANTFGFDYTLGGTKAIGGTGGLLKSGAGTVTINNSNSFTGDVTINQGVLNAASIANGGSSSALGAGTAIVLGGGTLGYTGVSDAVTDRSVSVNTTSTIQLDAGNLTISGLVDGTAGLVKTGTGTLVLDNPANFLGGTLAVTGGTVQVDEAAKLGAGAVALAGGTLAFTGTSAISVFQTVSLGAGGGTIQADNTAGTALTAAVTGTGGFTKNGSGTLTFSGNKNFTGGVTVNNGTLFINAGGWYSNPFGNTNVLTINPGGTVQTVGAHSLGTDQNTVVINGGTLQLGAEQYVTTLNMTGGLITGGELRNWGGTMTFPASSTGAVIASTFNLAGNAVLNVADGSAAADLTISGVIFNTNSLTKSGDGKLVLAGVNTYTSNTTVNAGTLELQDDARLTFVIPASGASNKISGAGTATLDGDFHINTTAAAALATGTWTIEDMTGTATYGTSFQVVNSDGSPWTSSGGSWTKVSGSQLWTYDQATGVLTLAVAGYEAWASQIGDSNQRDREDDPDTDGFTNLQEFLFGTNPTTSTGSLTSMTSDGSILTIRWRQRTSGAGYSLLESATLANPWVVSGATPSNDGPVDGDYQPRKAEVTIGAGRNFFRVEGVEN